MNYILGIVAIIVCLVLSTMNSFLDGFANVAYWGIVISIVYMVLSSREKTQSNPS